LLEGVEEEIGRRARLFDGAWVYLEFLAEVLGDEDPLSSDVVETYWVGTDLLDRVPSAELVARLEARFVGQVGGTWRESAARARAHHSYQVFEVYPWAPMLRAGLPPGPAVSVLDRCRVRSGEVHDVDAEWVTVSSRALDWDGEQLLPAAAGTERARWSVGGRSLMAPPVVGDVVALHWDWVCDVLTPDQVVRIEAIEGAQRAAVGLGGGA